MEKLTSHNQSSISVIELLIQSHQTSRKQPWNLTCPFRERLENDAYTGREQQYKEMALAHGGLHTEKAT